MKKLLNVLLILQFIFVQSAFADEVESYTPKVPEEVQDELIQHKKFDGVKKHEYINKTPIKDAILEHKSMAKRVPHTYIPKEAVQDELLERPIENGILFNLRASKKGEYEYDDVEDELMTDKFKIRAASTTLPQMIREDDFFIEKVTNPDRVRKIKHKKVYDFSKKPVIVKVKIKQDYSHKQEILEGDMIPFEAVNDFEIKGVQYKKGTEILGRVETLSPSDKMGVPETLKIDNFYLDGDEEILLHGSITKTGANRSIWVYPIYQAGNIAFYAAGFIVVPIHGGHAKLTTKEVFNLIYENPE